MRWNAVAWPLISFSKRNSTTNFVMNLRQRCEHIQKVLNRYYPDPPVPLDYKDTFTFLVAVVLSAQTTDGKVNEATKTLFEVAPTPQKLAQMTPIDVQRIIQSVGLAPRKSEYLVGLSRKIVDEFNGEVPRTLEQLESLPGVGRKTASVILSQAFGTPAFPVDTHIHRLALRWGLSKDEKNATKVQEDLCRLFPEDAWHNPSECPMCSWINKRTPPDTFSTFSPKKQQKGIIYYHERVAEMTSPGRVNVVEVKLETVPPEKNLPMSSKASGKRKRKTIAASEKSSDVPDTALSSTVAKKRRKRDV